MADDKINWQIEIDGKGALDTLDKVKASAKEIDLSKKALGDVNMRAAMSDLLATHRIAKDVADASKMETRARQDNLRLSRQQREEEAKRAQEAAKKALADRQSAIAGLRNIGIGGVVGALAMTRNMASSGFSDTLQGQQADVYGQLLNRQVAAIFAPLLEEKTKYVSQMTAWLQGLDAPQRESIRQMTMFAGSMAGLGYVVPKITKGLAAAVTGFMPERAGTAVTAAAGPLGTGLALMTSILMSSEKGRESLANLAKAFEPLIPAFTGIINDLTPPIAALSTAIADLVRWFNNWFPSQNNAAQTGTGFTGAFSEAIGIFAADFGHTLGIRALRDWGVGVYLDRGLFGPPRPGGGGNSLSPIPKGFEEIENAFTRINESATKMDLQQQTVNELQQANQWLAQLVSQGNSPIVQGAGNAIASALGF